VQAAFSYQGGKFPGAQFREWGADQVAELCDFQLWASSLARPDREVQATPRRVKLTNEVLA